VHSIPERSALVPNEPSSYMMAWAIARLAAYERTLLWAGVTAVIELRGPLTGVRALARECVRVRPRAG
jgi:hypothetical protein